MKNHCGKELRIFRRWPPGISRRNCGDRAGSTHPPTSSRPRPGGTPDISARGSRAHRCLLFLRNYAKELPASEALRATGEEVREHRPPIPDPGPLPRSATPRERTKHI